MSKKRLDQLLVSRGLVTGRNQAYAAIVTGEIKVDGEVCVKPSRPVDETANIEYRSSDLDYVSRGGVKLDKALEIFNIDVSDLTVLDSGISTGGFTDCLLRRGAKKVIGVDVGYGQLAWRLRRDERVELHERVNLRYLTPEMISGPADLAVLDLSFISLGLVMEAVIGCLKKDGAITALVKPQFEVGRGKVGRTGVVKEPGLQSEVLSSLSGRFIEMGLSVMDMTWSPIAGAKGNIEYWLYLSKKPSVGYSIEGVAELAAAVVAGAHDELGK